MCYNIKVLSLTLKISYHCIMTIDQIQYGASHAQGYFIRIDDVIAVAIYSTGCAILSARAESSCRRNLVYTVTVTVQSEGYTSCNLYM